MLFGRKSTIIFSKKVILAVPILEPDKDIRTLLREKKAATGKADERKGQRKKQQKALGNTAIYAKLWLGTGKRRKNRESK